MKWHTKSCWNNLPYQHLPEEELPDKSSSSRYETRKASTASRAFQVLPALALQETGHDIVSSGVGFFTSFLRTKKYLRNIKKKCASIFTYDTSPFLFYQTHYERILFQSLPLLTSPFQQLKAHSLVLYHKWKHLLISKLETVSPSRYTVLQEGSLYVTKAKFLGQTLIRIRKHSF